MSPDPSKIFLLFVLLATSCEKKQVTSTELPVEVVAWVGGEAITKAEFDSVLAERNLAQAPEETRKAVLLDLIEFHRLVASGKERGWDRDENARKAALRNVALRVREEIDDQFFTLEPPTDSEIEAYYKAHADDYRTQLAAMGSILIRHDSPEVAAKILTDALKNRSLPGDYTFGEIAREVSDDPSTKVRGGRMRWVTAEQSDTSLWPPEVFKVLFSLREAGEVSAVTRFDKGAFVLRLMDHRPSEAIPLQNVAAEISNILIEKKKAVLKEAFDADLEKRFPVRYPGG